MRLKSIVIAVGVVVLAVGLAGLIVACNDSDVADIPTPPPSASGPVSDKPSADEGLMVDLDEFDDIEIPDPLSTFKSKDPFKPQALPPTTTSTTTPSTTTPTSDSGHPSTSLTLRPPSPGSTTRPTTTPPPGPWPTPSTSTSTTSPTPSTSTSTLPPHTHYLEVRGVGTVGGEAVVTLFVDGSVFPNKRVGESWESSWGWIKVVDIDIESKVVTLLHGDETRIIPVGGYTYE